MKEAAAQLEKEDAERQQMLRQEEALQEQLRLQQKQQAEMQELEEAEAEFQELQRSRRQAATLASLPQDAPMFVAARAFNVGLYAVLNTLPYRAYLDGEAGLPRRWEASQGDP